jgi:hypothetical protein
MDASAAFKTGETERDSALNYKLKNIVSWRVSAETLSLSLSLSLLSEGHLIQLHFRQSRAR